MEECVFCRIIVGELPGSFVHQDDQAVVFLDLNQAARGHLLIVPREHVEHWHELEPATTAHMARLAAEWARPLVEAVQADGYNLQLNNGSAAGQDVMHAHLHLIPRWRRDGYYQSGPRHRRAAPGELDATAQLLRALQARNKGH
jgi:histidine triad (HIT) family protein